MDFRIYRSKLEYSIRVRKKGFKTMMGFDKLQRIG